MGRIFSVNWNRFMGGLHEVTEMTEPTENCGFHRGGIGDRTGRLNQRTRGLRVAVVGSTTKIKQTPARRAEHLYNYPDVSRSLPPIMRKGAGRRFGKPTGLTP